MKKRGWTNFHLWVRYDNKKIRSAVAHKIGWYTNSWSRAMMMDFLIKALRDFWCDVHSPWFINEMVSLSKDEYQQDMRADFGGHDDRIMALGIPLFSLWALQRYGGPRSLREEREELERSYGEHPVYQPAFNAEVPNLRKDDNANYDNVDLAGVHWYKGKKI